MVMEQVVEEVEEEKKEPASPPPAHPSTQVPSPLMVENDDASVMSEISKVKPATELEIQKCGSDNQTIIQLCKFNHDTDSTERGHLIHEYCLLNTVMEFIPNNNNDNTITTSTQQQVGKRTRNEMTYRIQTNHGKKNIQAYT